MKVVKNILTILCGLVLLAFSCKPNCGKIDKPKGIKSIDRENYNDVSTVYWNYFGYCDDRKYTSGDYIGVYGWRAISYDLFCIASDPKYLNWSSERARVVVWIKWELEEITDKIRTSDLTKKCFVRGEVKLSCLDSGECSTVAVEIFVTNPDDIYFEEEKE